jgi:hypothetical protein
VVVDPTTNRLSGGNYTYDANGNLTGITGQFTATYDVENRLRSISPTSGGTETYDYDLQNRRVYKSTSSGDLISTFYGAYGERFATGYPVAGTTNAENLYFGMRTVEVEADRYSRTGED